MLDENKKIEEIKKELLAFAPIIFMPFECFEEVAKVLYKLGYREQNDTVKEFIYKVLQIKSKRQLCLFNVYGEGSNDYLGQIKELASQYSVEMKE